MNIDLNLCPDLKLNNVSYVLLSCTLTKRLTHKELVEEFANRVKNAQTVFKQEINAAASKLNHNAPICQLLDKLLGVFPESGEINENCNRPITKLKDGSVKLSCPINSCNITTFKLKRHLKVAHKNLSDSQISFALAASRKFEKNKNDTDVEQKVETKSRKQHCYSNTSLVNKKKNYKECHICSILCKNISDHIQHTHKIARDDPNYKTYVHNAPVVPACLTAKRNGVVIKLAGDELEAAMKVHGTALAQQASTLAALKELRVKIDMVSNEIQRTSNQEKLSDLREQLANYTEEYKNERYKDQRHYSPSVKLWRDAFLSHLDIKGVSNAKRIANIAMDIIIPFEIQLGRDLNYEDLSNAKTVRDMLSIFKCNKNVSSASKIKYLKNFEQFLRFLSNDIDSPGITESDTNEQIISKDIKVKRVLHEVKNAVDLLGKDRGAEIIKSKAKAKEKLVSEEEMKDYLKEPKEVLKNLLIDFEKNSVSKYGIKQTIKVRNSLIAVATVRLGRRSKELSTMSLEEVSEADKEIVDGKEVYIIKVVDQKSTKTGIPAPVVFTQKEYRALNIFIDHLRPKLGCESEVVFPPRTKLGITKKDLSYSNLHHIMQSFSTTTGKKLSSRSSRASKVTNSRKNALSEQEKQSLAKAMNHSLQTAERYYNFDDLKNSVVKSLAIGNDDALSDSSDEGSLNLDSTVEDTTLSENPDELEIPSVNDRLADLSDIGNNSEIEIRVQDASSSFNTERATTSIESNKEIQATLITSTPSKSTLCSKRKSGAQTLDETIVHLRNKKVKTSNAERRDEKLAALPQLKNKIEEIMKEILVSGGHSTLLTKTGQYSVQPITKKLDKNFMKLFSTKDMRYSCYYYCL